MSKSAFTLAYDEFRTLLKEMREMNGLTQVEVAKRLGLPQSYVSKVEAGERRLDWVETAAFCDAVGTDLVKFAGLFQQRAGKGGASTTKPRG